MLSGVLNLVAYAGHPSETAAMLEVIERLADHQPSRAVVLCGEPDGDGIDARISTSCRISGGTAGVALETVLERIRAMLAAGIIRRVAPACELYSIRVLSGRLSLTIGFDDYVLEPGDSVSFDSTTPHRLHNEGDEPVAAVWFVVR